MSNLKGFYIGVLNEMSSWNLFYNVLTDRAKETYTYQERL